MVVRSRFTWFALLLMMFSILLSLSKGSTSITIGQLLFDDNALFNSIFLQIRLPRTMTAFVCGGLLALSGSLMQLLLQNPLADPYILGISGGAACMTLLMMLIGISGAALIGGAWVGSLLAASLIFLLAKKHRFQPHALLLIGIALACGFSAGISLLLLLTDDSTLHSMLFWLAGDLNQTQFPWIGMSVLIIGMIACYLLAPGLNLLGRGETEARLLGLSSQYYRIAIYLLSTLFSATAVSLAGCIGFVGLIIPHLTRSLVAYDHRISLPIALMLGGSLLTLADTLARTLFAPEQLPVGIIMAILGVPIFIRQLQR